MIIAIVNQKGGVGKTTTAINLSAYLAAMGKFVLLLDIDPQANATSGVGIAPSPEKNIYHAFIGERSLKDLIEETFLPTHKVVPSHPHLAGATVELVNKGEREFVLYNHLLEIKNNFDYILIDCPPSLDILTLNGLVAADKVLMPVQAEYYALEGIGNLINTINLVQENLKPNLDVLGAVITMYDKRNKLSGEVLQEMYKNFPFNIFRSVIPRNVRLTEAPSFGKTILEYDPHSKGARAYERLAKEILDYLNYS